MPCGGIGPTDGKGECTFMCGKPDAVHFMYEWDTYIHARCVMGFLSTQEGQILITHGHTVTLDFSLEKGGD
jgi:hypothetical protein